MPGKVKLSEIFPLVERFKTRQSPLTCRHRYRCHCHDEPAATPDTTTTTTTPAAAPPAPPPPPLKSNKAHAEELQTLENGWRKLVAAILDTLRDYTDAYEAVRLTMRRVCEPGFP